MKSLQKHFKLQFSAHLCGRFARAAVCPTTYVDLFDGEFYHGFRRIQINALKYDFSAVKRLRDHHCIPVIIQHRDGPFPTLPDGLVALHDQSGGSGIYWLHARCKRLLMALWAMLVVSQITATRFWIDMESGVRDENDWFEVSKCRAVCKAIWEVA